MKALTPEFRVSFPNVFKPQVNKFNNREEYTVVAVFPLGADLSKLKEAAEAAIIAKWGADKKKWPSKLRTPFRDQAEKAKNVDGKQVLPQGFEEGAIFMNLKSNKKPGLVDASNEDIIDSSEFYPGCWARASINAYAYDAAGNTGVSFGLNNLQKLRDGEPLGGRTLAQDDFAPVATGGSANAVSASDIFS